MTAFFIPRLDSEWELLDDWTVPEDIIVGHRNYKFAAKLGCKVDYDAFNASGQENWTAFQKEVYQAKRPVIAKGIRFRIDRVQHSQSTDEISVAMLDPRTGRATKMFLWREQFNNLPPMKEVCP